MPWQLWRFHNTGRLWHTEGTVDPLSWPASATLCNCVGVSVARLHRELRNGTDSFEELTAVTGAGSVCGACKPLLKNLISCRRDEPQGNGRLLAGASIVVTLMTLPFLLPFDMSGNQYVHNLLLWNQYSQNQYFQQASGFCLVAFAVIMGMLGLRKRYSGCNWGSVAGWRMLHVILGLITIALLILHAGLHMGQGSSLWLMVNFLGLSLSGSLLGSLCGLGHWLPSGWFSSTRLLSRIIHILFFLPLPLLLGLHITLAYEN